MLKRKTKPKRKHGEYRVYRLPLGMRLTLSAIVFLSLFLIVGLVQPISQIPGTGNIIVLAVQVIVVFFGLSWTWQAVFVDRLIVSNEGMEFHGMGIVGFTTWDNLSHFDWIGRGRTRYWGIRLHREIPLQMNWIARLGGYRRYFSDFLPITHWTTQRWTLGRRVERFKQTPLGQDMLYYAPHLFEVNK